MALLVLDAESSGAGRPEPEMQTILKHGPLEKERPSKLKALRL